MAKSKENDILISKNQAIRDLKELQTVVAAEGDPFLAGALNRPIGCLEGQPAAEAVPIEQYNDLRDAFIDFVCSGIPNPAPYCGNRCPECVDGRGWCKEDPGTCKGFNPTGERNGNGC